MATLDHIIVRVESAADSAAFYSSILGFPHEVTNGPFEIIWINAGLTLNLMQDKPNDPQHLAFELPDGDFKQTLERIRTNCIPYCSTPFSRERQGPGVAYGAGGNANSIYFSGPDAHSLEIRLYNGRQA